MITLFSLRNFVAAGAPEGLWIVEESNPIGKARMPALAKHP
jgi:hypothetical protein